MENMIALCRACLSQEVHLYTNEDTQKNEILSGLLNTFTALTGYETHLIYLGGIFNLCQPCEEKLKLCYDFRELCLQSYSQLEQQFIKMETNEEISGENCVDLESNIEMVGVDIVFNNKIETVENFDSESVADENKVAITNPRRLEKYSEETVQKLLDELNDLSNELKMCVSCDFVAVKFLDLRHHMVKEHPNDKDNWCNKCNKLFHPLKEHKQCINILTCKLCGKISVDRAHLIRHYQAHTDSRNFVCDQCNKSYTTKSGLDVHYKMHKNARYKCKSCSNSYIYQTSLRRHIFKTGHSQVDAEKKCEACNEKFKNLEDFENHKCINQAVNSIENDSKEIDLELKGKNNSSGAKKFACNQCEESYTSRKQLFMHCKSHNNETYKCEFCSNIYSHQISLQKHVLEAHSQVDFDQNCEACNKKFSSKEDLENHDCTNQAENSEEEKKPVTTETPSNLNVKSKRKKAKYYLCNICGKQLRRPSGLRLHMEIHAGIKPFKCQYCDFRTRLKDILKKHQQTHTGIKPHKCDVCLKSFTQSSSLNLHLKTHQGDLGRSHPCLLCEKRYFRKIDLQYHMRVHTGEKPYRCTICPQAFMQSGHLKHHIKLHSDARPHICRYCGKGFKATSSLKSHELIHTGEKPFKCTVCNTDFRKSNHLKVHMKRHMK